MRAILLSTLVVPALILGGCSMYGGDTASASSSATAKVAPDFAAAVSIPGRPEVDTKLDASRKPAELLSFLGLEQGDAALDVLAGGGYFSEIMGRAVGAEGKVSAHNVAFFTESEKGKAKWKAVLARNANVTLNIQPYHKYSAPANSFDFALLHMVYHDAYFESEQFKFPRMDPAKFLSSLYAAMKPGGIVGVVDHIALPGDTRQTVEKLHRIDPAVVKADFTAAGFVLEAESDMFANPDDDHSKLVFDPSIRGKTDRFVMKFRKPG